MLAAAEHICQAQTTARAVIVGANAEAVRAALTPCSAEVLVNDKWAEGMASSIRLAVAWAEMRECDALLLVLCDQPKLDARHLNRLIAEHELAALPVASFYAQKQGVPAIFPRSSFPDLAALRGDFGASKLLNGKAAVARVLWPEGEFDVDEPDAEQRLLTNQG